MNIYYNSLDINCKSSIGAVKRGTDLEINVYGNADEPCSLVLMKDGGEAQYLRMDKFSVGWKLHLKFPDVGLYFYCFKIGNEFAGKGALCNIEFCKPENIKYYQILVYQENFHVPDWFKGGTMYQIFPDRFFKVGQTLPEEGKWLHTSWNELPEFRKNAEGKILNNDFFGGNLQGILQKLDYLKELNITILYLNPIFRAYSNHRYDTGNYLQIDPLLGTEEDLKQLIQEASCRGIKIILDGVFNHTGDDSVYFNKYNKYDSIGAYQSKDSPYYAWYTFKKYPDLYDSWWGIDVLPAINESCPSYVSFIAGEDGVLRHWMKLGIAGFRLDVADELPDEFIQQIRSAIKSENPDGIVLGEVWEDASNKIAYGKRRKYFQGNELDSVMNYPLKDAIIQFVLTTQANYLREIIAQLRDHYPKEVLDSLMNLLGTHDTARILTVLNNKILYDKEEMSKAKLSYDERIRAKEKLKFATVLLFTIFGIPCIYYGDEIGMEGYGDPFCRKPFPWSNMDQDLLNHYKRLTLLRKSMPDVFKDGEFVELYAKDPQMMLYKRQKGKELCIVCVNLGGNKFDLKYTGEMYEIFSDITYKDKFTIYPNSFSILCNKKI